MGDLFAIPIDETRVGVGQIVATYGKSAYYLAAFDLQAPDGRSVDLDTATQSEVLFLALSFDAKLVNGDWPIFGRRPVPSSMPLPAYKEQVGTPDSIRVDVVDYSGTRRRAARPSEVDLLPNRKLVGAIRLEKALKAKHGIEPWNDAYADLVPKQTTTAAMFPSL